MLNAELYIVANALKDKRLSGVCVTFGLQGVLAQYPELEELLQSAAYPYSKLAAGEITYNNITRAGRTPHQEVFFKMLGFSRAESIDCFPNENPTYLLDLNEPVPKELHSKYDLVFDGGTAEHCFNIAGVFSNAVRLLKPGGRIAHLSPIHAGARHGYYNFSPDLFFEFYGENGFSQMEARILVTEPGNPPYWFSYAPGDFLPEDFYGRFAIMFFTGIGPLKSADKIVTPVQSCWTKKFSGAQEAPPAASWPKTAVKTLLSKCPFVYSLAKELWQRRRAAVKMRGKIFFINCREN